MPSGLRRFQETGRSHFVTFSCYRRQPYFAFLEIFDLFLRCLERTRVRFDLLIYGYVVMPEHVHLLLSEPAKAPLAEALHYLKLSFSKLSRPLRPASAQVSAQKTGANLGHRQPNSNRQPNPDYQDSSSFWEKRYYDRNVRDYREFTVKLRYLHRNPVKRGLVRTPEDWKWSSYGGYALREIGVVGIESEWTARERKRNACGGDS
ncbi:MAG: transposase [Terriglobales bacterium]